MDRWLPKGRVGGGLDWEFGVSRCKLSYIERINMFPLYSTEYYIQYLLINIVKKKKESDPNKPTKRNKET